MGLNPERELLDRKKPPIRASCSPSTLPPLMMTRYRANTGDDKARISNRPEFCLYASICKCNLWTTPNPYHGVVCAVSDEEGRVMPVCSLTHASNSSLRASTADLLWAFGLRMGSPSCSQRLGCAKPAPEVSGHIFPAFEDHGEARL